MSTAGIQSTISADPAVRPTHDVAILGAGGLTGRELLDLLQAHPGLRPRFITSDRNAGRSVGEIFPQLEPAYPELCFSAHSTDIPPEMPVFLAVPNESALELTPHFIKQGNPVVDLSGSFRLHDRQIWEEFYRLPHSAFEFMDRVVFGLPELFRDKISAARAVANPGCYPTGSIVPLYLLGSLREQIQSVVIDAKSGVSGAGGRTEDAGFSFQSVYENFRAYKILKHQHQPEIQEYAAHELAGNFPCEIVFTPHLLPIFRGILSTIVIHWDAAHIPAADSILNTIRSRSAQEPFLR
ncbi:MAG: N-acetyl-gamma-glutamyl-phosphate reductase, partial [Leptospiraceae bacterium]|nr:N-acetyl-gamma-glutamyl-phosphate reductase [Leptospiraceae bacterium]